ncbi:dynein regulatory complex subunit 3 [Juglans microcarpa x Juglans regia]|uniref:dynein regulatory complex subunit 3 n=1 Tax=Juglans microcarpa x Juglans regia TaxID=2249226 RepID=UPI001B7E226A|nr:dynein regulatory complex subunit 3 [Juglans microcarpa x Juglans regia]
MTRLSSEQVLKDNATSDPNSVPSLKLTYRALSDVSCLSEFKILEKLDLSFNNLSSLEGLKACVNLKWLAVVQNKLESLRGIEGLSKLTVLNAGKNKLRSMDEVGSLLSLRALILNDNEIISICRLDQMKDLNTLVLSRNPIREIGESLVKLKSITKLSLSNCQLQTIGSTLKSCVELKELRLAHNQISTLPDELARNKKLQNLDLGNNVLLRWSNLKVLTSLANLRNLNLQGNPVSEREELTKKIKNALPNLKIFNAKPTDKYTKNEDSEMDDKVDYSVNASNKLEVPREERRDGIGKINSKHHLMDGKDDRLDDAKGVDVKKKLKRNMQETNDNVSEKEVLICKDEKRDEIRRNYVKDRSEDSTDNARDLDVEKKSRKKKQKIGMLSQKEVEVHPEVVGEVEKKLKKKTKVEKGEFNVIDDPDVSFVELFAADSAGIPKYDYEKKIIDNTTQDTVGGLVTFSVKKKKAKHHGSGPSLDLYPRVEIGMGGASTWGDE